ncbi:hypothetical protein M409DRAFT_16026 [Zasmidium cellare ATCC 36951]|uniref:DASH complex subunit SPC34 n=1 Tax=Zasmidium cellare ATCC 36951 TaxID=1080233 RepID=A0A6A6D6A6_ZASCE|nr:uncharacterized protein M409DRAFT_16026 [Zasmidium cellare ATCC 36951]KAF2173752.1 hypothetical protein M409DRAFT_16026 [Zasmidium cellare ATCC 36951]
MASLFNSHLEQISLCATSIGELPFQGPKAFSNALLSQHDITALIRDTEAHERALFHLAPPPLPSKSAAQDFVAGPPSGPAQSTTSRRATVYGQRQPKSKAVAAVLGGELYQRTRKEGAAVRQKGEVDVEVLLEGAEKLLGVYPVPGAAERITQLRRRHQQLAANIAHYETVVSQQSAELASMNQPTYDDDIDEILDDEPTVSAPPMTKEDLEREEAEIQELERKKKTLEDRVTGMERDLGGLMR